MNLFRTKRIYSRVPIKKWKLIRKKKLHLVACLVKGYLRYKTIFCYKVAFNV